MSAKRRSRQAFGQHADAKLRLSALLGLITLFLLMGGWYVWARSPQLGKYQYRVGQPITFSHRHHVEELAIDCRYCHGDVARGPNAGMPASQACWSCHSQIFTESPMLEPLRQSITNNEPIRWQRVTDLKDVVYFNHAAHIQNGVSCQTCHGDVASMGLVYQAKPLTMKWCVECHRKPERHQANFKRVIATRSTPPPPIDFESEPPDDSLHTQINLTDCTTCHR